MTNKSGVVLIGMPGAGKSTVGVVLAKRLGLSFVDTDLVIQSVQGGLLQDILDREGLAGFRLLEERTLLALDAENAVIATGGSVVYSLDGMAALSRLGTVVFLDVPLAELTRRVRDMDRRGMVIDTGQSFADLFALRLPLYRRYAEVTIDCTERSVEEIVTEIVRRLSL